MPDRIQLELLDHMRDGVCPVCSLIRQRTLQAMEGFLYESVNDPELRRMILQAHGLCNTHSGLLFSLGDPLAHAVLYGDLLLQAIAELKQSSGCKPSVVTDDCLFCRRALCAEQQYETAFMEAYGERVFREGYLAGGMLCVTHLRHILRLKQSARQHETILSDTLALYERLSADLRQVRRKSDYRFAAEPWTASERIAWRRAVAVVNDTAGLRK